MGSLGVEPCGGSHVFPSVSGRPELEERLAQRLSGIEYPGLASPPDRDRFVAELADAAQFVNRVRSLGRRPGAHDVRAPTLDRKPWSARRAIAQWAGASRPDEATWLAFLTTFFGPDERPGRDPWLAVRTVYSGFGEGRVGWEGSETLARLIDVCRRNSDRYARLPRGNHRKYEPRSFDHPQGLAASACSFVDVIERRGGMAVVFAGPDASPRARFDRLMSELSGIVSFGRTGRFDFLTLLGYLAVWDLQPGKLYLAGATGPARGARRILDDKARPLDDLDRELSELAVRLDVPIQAMEDAICNWQKRRP